MSREYLPGRRPNFIQKVRIENQVFYLCCGEYPDGRLGEIFVDTAKMGTFARGVLDALARVVSVSVQCGTPVEEIVKALRGLNFPPHGPVSGSPHVKESKSVADWLAQEIEATYLGQEKTAGHVAEDWRSGA